MGGGSAGSGGGLVLSDSFPTSHSSIKQIESESFLFLGRVQPTPFYFCWVGANLPARLLTTFITHSPGSLRKCILSRRPRPTAGRPPGPRGQAGSSPPGADCSGCQPDGHSGPEPTPASLPMSLLGEAQQPWNLSRDPVIQLFHRTWICLTSLKQHRVFLPNPLSMPPEKVSVRSYIFHTIRRAGSSLLL